MSVQVGPYFMFTVHEVVWAEPKRMEAGYYSLTDQSCQILVRVLACDLASRLIRNRIRLFKSKVCSFF